MNLVIYGRTARPAIAGLLTGAKLLGLRPVLQRPMYDGALLPATAVFVDGWHGACRQFGESYQRAGVPVFILDLPRLRTVDPTEPASDLNTYVGVFAESLHHLPSRIGNRYPVQGPIDSQSPDHILVCGQKPLDAAHDMNAAQLARWATETVSVTRQYGLPVVFRPHPKSPPDTYAYVGADEVQSPTLPLREAFARAAAVVVHNSTAGVEAIDAGVPVLYTASEQRCCFSAYATPLGAPTRMLSAAERRVFLGRVGATQWTHAQLADGTALRCLLQDAPWPEPEEWYPLGRPMHAVYGAEQSASPPAANADGVAPTPAPAPENGPTESSRTISDLVQPPRVAAGKSTKRTRGR